MANGECIQRLVHAGFTESDAMALRRVSMTLHRWHEMECGNGDDVSSWAVVRGERKNSVTFEYDDNGAPYIERHFHRGSSVAQYTRIGDRERGAQKRLAKIMARYPDFQAYVQTDPRGASLYILRPSDVSADTDIASCYNRGIAVYK
jgi:hypothetical protein